VLDPVPMVLSGHSSEGFLESVKGYFDGSISIGMDSHLKTCLRYSKIIL
jgi:hypothetical protein